MRFLLLFAILAPFVNCINVTLYFEPSSLNKETLVTKPGLPWGKAKIINVTVLSDQTVEPWYHVSFRLECANPEICTVNNGSFIRTYLMKVNDYQMTFPIHLETHFLGRSHLVTKEVLVEIPYRDPAPAGIDFDYFEVVALRGAATEIMNKVFTYFLTVFIIVNTFMMGTQLHPAVLKGILKRPVGPLIGFVCQYIMMPILGFLYGLIFLRGWPNLRFGLFAYSCSPGGGMSNFWSILLDGNLNLSVAMTFVSNMGALFMMPLWLHFVGSTLLATTDGHSIKPPIVNILGALALLIVPIGIGMVTAMKRPQFVPKIKRILKYFVIVAMVGIIALSIMANWYMFLLIRWYTLVPGMLMPISGYVLAYGIAFVLRQRYRECRTIAIETGIQNAGVTIVVCQMALPAPDSDMTFVMPLCCLIFTGPPLWCWLAGRTVAKKKCGYVDEDVEYDEKRKWLELKQSDLLNNESPEKSPDKAVEKSPVDSVEKSPEP